MSNNDWSDLKIKVPCKATCKDETCGAFGPPRAGKHLKACTCSRCQKGQNRTRGLKHQTDFAKAFNVPGVSQWRPGNEQDWLGVIRMEVKSGASECGPLINFYRRTLQQSNKDRRIGDNRVFVAGGIADDLSVVQLEKLKVPQFVYDVGTALGYWAAE